MTTLMTEDDLNPEQRKATEALTARLRKQHGERAFGIADLLVNLNNMAELLTKPCCKRHHELAMAEMGKNIAQAGTLLCALSETDHKVVIQIGDELKKFERSVEQELQQDQMGAREHEGEAREIIERVSGVALPPLPAEQHAVAPLSQKGDEIAASIDADIQARGYSEAERRLAPVMAGFRMALAGAVKYRENPMLHEAMIDKAALAFGSLLSHAVADLLKVDEAGQERLMTVAQEVETLIRTKAAEAVRSITQSDVGNRDVGNRSAAA